jgi:hypothetical protein
MTKVHLYKVADLDKAIKGVEADGKRLKDKIHSVLVSIMKGWESKQLDKDHAARLVSDLVKVAGYHAKAVSNWVVVKTPLKWADETKVFYAPADAVFMGKAFIACRDEPFWEITKPADPKPFDALALLDNLLSKNDKRVKSDKRKPDDVTLPPEVAKALRDALNKVKNDNVPH